MFAVCSLLGGPGPTLGNEEGQRVAYVIPIKGMIERGLLYVMRRSVAEAVDRNADAIVLDMDTPGGRVDAAEEIIRMLIDLPESIHTYTFVNKDALSAGALIAVATDDIYMAPGSRIGASAIVTITGDIKEGDLKEKHVSALVALVSSAAERKGHDPNLIEAMVRKEKEYKIGDDVICPEGQLLTLTDLDATRLVAGDTDNEDGEPSEKRPLLASGIVKDMAELRVTIGLEDAEITEITITAAERVARFIEMLSILLLGGGLLCLFIEFKLPGFGIFGIMGLLLLALFFWGHNVAGLSGSLELILFVCGILLLALEVFVIPGFGVVGVSGITFILLALLMSMVEHYPGTPWFRPPDIHLRDAFKNLGLALAMAFGLGLIVARFLPKTPGFQHLMLSARLGDNEGDAAPARTTVIPGAAGTAATLLHPAGLGMFEGRRVNVVARGAFIDKDAPIVVAETHGNRIVVDVVRDAKESKS